MLELYNLTKSSGQDPGPGLSQLAIPHCELWTGSERSWVGSLRIAISDDLHYVGSGFNLSTG